VQAQGMHPERNATVDKYMQTRELQLWEWRFVAKRYPPASPSILRCPARALPHMAALVARGVPHSLILLRPARASCREHVLQSVTPGEEPRDLLICESSAGGQRGQALSACVQE